MRDHVTELLSRLVEIDSVNPTLVPGGAGEGAIAAFVAAWAEANGLDAAIQDFTTAGKIRAGAVPAAEFAECYRRRAKARQEVGLINEAVADFEAADRLSKAPEADGERIEALYRRAIARAHEGALVVFVDIAPGSEEMRALAQHAGRLVVLDHHVTARDRFENDLGLQNAVEGRGHTIRFDLTHSGAILAWQHFHPDEPAPDLLRYVEDQDLWSWKLPDSEEVNAAISSYPRDFETWDGLAKRPIAELAAEGFLAFDVGDAAAAGEHIDDIARDQPHRRERQERDAEDCNRGQPEAAEQVGAHDSSSTVGGIPHGACPRVATRAVR